MADRRGLPFSYTHPIAGRFVYHPSDYLSRRLFLYDDFEREELQFAVEHARAGGTILDVGANVGLYTVACAHAAGSHGRVIAIEPGPGTFAKLKSTCSRLRLSNVTPLAVAASRVNGIAHLLVRHDGRDVHQHLTDGRHGGGDNVAVETRRLDELCGADHDAVTLVKIDVEGHEVSVLEGAPRILGGRRASLIVEFYPAGLASAGASAAQLWELLRSTHECIAVLRGDGSHQPPRLASIMALQAQDAFNTLWVPRRSLAA